MLIPKASHLVERVAERLLRSGALDESAAQLLRPPVGSEADPAQDTQTDPAGASFGFPAETAGLASAPARPPMPTAASVAAAAAEMRRRSSLFAPPPEPVAYQPAAPQAPVTRLIPTQPPAGSGLPGMANAPLPATGGLLNGEAPGRPFEGTLPGGVSAGVSGGAPGLPSPAIIGQARPLGQPALPSAVLDRPGEFTASPSGLGQRGNLADPAAALLQGPTSIDAVSLERAGMVDWSRTRTRISEEFRLVQRQIIRSAFGPGAEPGFSNLLLVTSARPGEGKSFMSTNLSGSIARQGDHHVLLVDADSKRDSICYSLGLAQARGLLDLAANPKLDPAPLIVKTPIERLSILPVGRERERSAELFSTKEMTRLIQSLGRRYADRLLILDAPPCLSTSDPAVLAQVVGQILFVVEADRTQRDEIEASLDLIQACPTITMVLNKQQISSRYTFGAYSSYYSS